MRQICGMNIVLPKWCSKIIRFKNIFFAPCRASRPILPTVQWQAVHPFNKNHGTSREISPLFFTAEKSLIPYFYLSITTLNFEWRAKFSPQIWLKKNLTPKPKSPGHVYEWCTGLYKWIEDTCLSCVLWIPYWILLIFWGSKGCMRGGESTACTCHHNRLVISRDSTGFWNPPRHKLSHLETTKNRVDPCPDWERTDDSHHRFVASSWKRTAAFSSTKFGMPIQPSVLHPVGNFQPQVLWGQVARSHEVSSSKKNDFWEFVALSRLNWMTRWLESHR